MGNIPPVSSEKIVQTDHFRPSGEQPVAEVASQKPRSTSHKNSFISHRPMIPNNDNTDGRSGKKLRPSRNFAPRNGYNQ
jgi:hypothetical protein